MMRILFWIALIVLVVMAVRSKLRAMRVPDPQAGERSGAAPTELEGETMSCCAHCHVYFPASEAVRADGQDYCSPAHARLPAK